MGMMDTLAKMAIQMAIEKGVSSVLKGGNGGGVLGQASPSADQGGLGDILGQVLGGASGGASKAGPTGGLGGLLEQLAGGAAGKSGGSSGGLGDLLGQLAGSKTRGGGDLGDIFGDFLGSAIPSQNETSGNSGSFGDIFNKALAGEDVSQIQATREQEAAAALMLKAMIQSAKSDGKIDRGEQQKLLENLGDVSNEERAFVEREMAAPVDVDGLVEQVPHGMEQQVYLMSLMTIDLDNNNEAQYLHSLATGLDLDHASVNAIHEQLGVPTLYR